MKKPYFTSGHSSFQVWGGSYEIVTITDLLDVFKRLDAKFAYDALSLRGKLVSKAEEWFDKEARNDTEDKKVLHEETLVHTRL